MNRQSQYRTWHTERSRGYVVDAHRHRESQLILSSSGALQVSTEAGRWLVPPHLAVWIPGGVLHSVEFLATTKLWTLYWDSRAIRQWAPRNLVQQEFVLQVSPLLRELVSAMLVATVSTKKYDLIARLILQELGETQKAPTFLPMPTTPLGRRVAMEVLKDLASPLHMELVAKRAASSSRTISRLFPAETGLTFRSWRQRARIVLAMDKLSTGKSVFVVATECGFESTAAFSYAFRQVAGMSPSTFVSGKMPDANSEKEPARQALPMT